MTLTFVCLHRIVDMGKLFFLYLPNLKDSGFSTLLSYKGFYGGVWIWMGIHCCKQWTCTCFSYFSDFH